MSRVRLGVCCLLWGWCAGSRLLSAAFGCALPPLTFMICKKLRMSNSTSFLAGSMVVFDLMNSIESRLVLMDSQVMF